MKSGSSLPMRSAARTHAARRGVVLRSTQGPFSSWPRETADRESAEANVGEFCSINKVEKSLGEMEQEFLQALASYYNEGKAIMSDEEFSLLKEELLWKGSTVPVLDGKEQRFLEAAQAYSRGQPIISDQAFDALKADLKANNSIVTAQGPRCSIRSRKMYSDLEVDYLKMTLLNVPGVLIVLAVMFGADYLSGFEITKAIELPPPLGIGLLWGFVLPAAYVLSNSITNILLKDALILKGKCPNCSNEVSSYFGEVRFCAGWLMHALNTDNCCCHPLISLSPAFAAF